IRRSQVSANISLFARAFRTTTMRECRWNDARSRTPKSMRNGARSPREFCNSPSAKIRARQIRSAPSFPKRRRGRDRRSHCAEYLLVDLPPPGRDRHRASGEDRQGPCRALPVARRVSADTASPNRKRIVREKVLWQIRAPPVRQREALQLAGFLSDAALPL